MPGATRFVGDVYARRRELGDPAKDLAARLAIIEHLKTLYGRTNSSRSDQIRVDHLFTQTDLAERLCAAQRYQEMFATFMAYQMESAGKRRWGNRVPRDLFELEHLLRFFPNAKVVVCVRNVLDFLVSDQGQWKVSERRSDPLDAERMRRLYHPVIRVFSETRPFFSFERID